MKAKRSMSAHASSRAGVGKMTTNVKSRWSMNKLRPSLSSTKAVPQTEEYEVLYMVVPPDGGWGWFIVVGSFLCNFIIDGIIYSYGNLISDISRDLQISKTEVALAGSITVGIFYMTGPFISALTNKYGFRMVMMTGSLIGALGFYLSGYANSIELLYVTSGCIGGIGIGMIYAPSVIAVGFYFEKWRALATSLAVCGSGVGTLVLAPIVSIVTTTYGWRFTVQLQAGMILICGLVSILFRPLYPKPIQVRPDLDTGASYSRTTSVAGSNTSLYSVELGDIRSTSESTQSRLFSIGENRRYPTHAEVLQENNLKISRSLIKKDESENVLRTPDKTVSFGPSRIQRVDPRSSTTSRMSTRVEQPVELATVFEGVEMRERMKHRECICLRYFRSCSDRFWCFNHFCCCCRDANTTNYPSQFSNVSPINGSSRPMYRDDIFYGASLMQLPEYTKSTAAMNNESRQQMPSIDYHLSVTRVTSAGDINEDYQPCVIYPKAIKRALRTLLDTSLLSSAKFNLIAFCGFFGAVGGFIPYVYVTERAIKHDMPATVALWLISAIGISNTIGRLLCGMVSFLPGNPSTAICYVTLVIAGMATIISAYDTSIPVQFAYCIVFGISTACMTALRPIIVVESLGLNRLTNAFGLLSFFQGVGSLLGAPIGGILNEMTGNFHISFLLAGSLIILSGMCLIPLNMTIRCRQTKKNDNSSS